MTIKQILASISILLLLILFSISDFDLESILNRSDTIEDQDPRQSDCRGYQILKPDRHECIEYRLSEQSMQGSDGACVAASMEMLAIMNRYDVDCLLITNKGWIPATLNPVTRHWVNWSLSDDAPY